MKRILSGIVSMVMIVIVLVSCLTVDVSAAQVSDEISTHWGGRIVYYVISNSVKAPTIPSGAYCSYWQYWGSYASKFPEIRDAGCRIIAQSKLLAEAKVLTGKTPDDYLVWGREQGYFEKNGVKEQYKVATGDGMIAFAKKSGVEIKRSSVALSGSNSSADAAKIMELINKGYYVILESGGHQAYVGRAVSKDVGQPVICDNEHSTKACHTFVGSYNKYYKAWYYSVSGTPTQPVEFPVEVNFEKTDSNSMGKYTITETNAILTGKVTVSGGSNNLISQVGCYLYDANGNYIAKAVESVSFNGSNDYANLLYNVNNNMKYTLTPGTTYKYKFYAKVSGKDYYSSAYSFTTTKSSTPEIKVNFEKTDSNSMGKYTVTETNAILTGKVTVVGGTNKSITSVGCYLYDASGVNIAKATESVSFNGSYDYAHLLYNVNKNMNYTLTSGKTYKYKFYAKVNGKDYYSSEYSFTTPHTHSYSSNWIHDDDNHWHECSCGEKSDVAAHTWDSGKVTKPATETETGIMTYTCTVCKKTRNETIPKIQTSSKGKVTLSNVTVAPGGTVDVTVSLTGFPKCSTVCISNISFNNSQLKLVSGKWDEEFKKNASISSEIEPGREEDVVIITFDSDREINGNIAKLRFEASNGADLRTETITAIVNTIEDSGATSTVNAEGTISIARYKRGDVNGDGILNNKDAIYLLKHVVLGSMYPITQDADMNGDGVVNNKDAIYLLKHVVLGDMYPLKNKF